MCWKMMQELILVLRRALPWTTVRRKTFHPKERRSLRGPRRCE